MREILVRANAELSRFFGMNSPSQSLRLAMYRKAGVHIGKLRSFGRNNWLDIYFRDLIYIEDDALLSCHIQILTHSFLMTGHPIACSTEKEGFLPVIIKKNARIGMHVVILGGVSIGENSIIGAGSVVIDDIPPNCVAVGVPAKPVKYFNSVEVTVEKCSGGEEKVSSKHQRLYLKCKTCGVEFGSLIRCNKQIFKTMYFQDEFHVCPNGHKNRYEKKDYFLRD
jgi:acetyltransferase-like isoleucine patch superfamily enzyme